jgi:plastocyanin
MRRPFLVLCLTAAFATAASAKDIYLSVGGKVGNFVTDMRIFNPSTTKDIQVLAYLLPASGSGTDNSGVQPKTITIAKRSQVVYDDVVASLFAAGGVAGVRLKSDDDFVATQRIYAFAADKSTTGQYVPGLDVSSAKKKGVLIQLKATGGKGQAGTFRTNVGVLNPNGVAANVTWRLYDKNNALAGAALTQTLPPYAVISPLGLTAFATNVPSTADLTDAWLSYDSDQPLFAYGSVVDNTTDDGTLIPSAEDTGVAATQQPGPVTGKVYNFSLRAGSITVTPTLDIKPGDTVTFRITATEANHGFEMLDPNSGDAIAPVGILTANQTIERQVTFAIEGTYQYFCTNAVCSTVPGHAAMYGKFDVGKASPPDDRPTY